MRAGNEKISRQRSINKRTRRHRIHLAEERGTRRESVGWQTMRGVEAHR